ncbi:peroxiredoxin [Actinomycetospora sp. NBRC 106375]|uniref:peroxiredoxin n=1 Tax=Actinomycetospora sp. NBRC 106375 TaxID=3032207 RepID=UPI0024A15F2E|nr:peroxiredoxin [Actinomycetospora sp. NBRC 106375]GLZ45258.1 peroxiredoxin [Actinomycetospora sp. NBRC 106375]
MQAGDTAPDFELADDTGTRRTLSELLAGGPVVLFFYPLASSGGCTQESCHFRDLAGEFAAVGAQRVGISADSVEKQHAFSSEHSFDYPLLSDPGGVVAKQFGAKRSWLPALPVKRKTFVIDTDRTVLGVIGGEMKFDNHADDALALLRSRQGA